MTSSARQGIDVPCPSPPPSPPHRPLVLVGAGKMGGALLKGWLDRGLDAQAVVVVDPAPPADSAAYAEVGRHRGGRRAAGRRDREADRARRQAADHRRRACRRSAPLVGKDTLALSIAAGTTLKNLKAGLGDIAIVRSIPNTPAQVGRGVTVAIANDKVGKAAQALVTDLARGGRRRRSGSTRKG